MQKVKMGGEKKTLRIFIEDNNDITDSLLSLQQGGRKLDLGLKDLIYEKYHGLFNIEIIRESIGRSDLMIQQLGVVPEELLQHKLDDENIITAQFNPRLFEEQVDVVVFSLQPEITHSLWRHRQKDYLFYPHPDWKKRWTPLQKQWFREYFIPIGLIQVQQFKENFVRLIRAIKERLNAHIIVYNCSSVDLEDQTYNYYKLQNDVLSLRIHKFNFALIEISTSEGISIIDVDRLIAELGGERHVMKRLSYSKEACHAICQEFQKVIEDIGFFENRPLLMQIGQRGD
ncbi:hypothetical protein BROC_01307 [Candidatus Brocadiaceae bacterium]|nr:hypothetical protein BROC_01307 [Candidatus Brocadiaceae bacterium]